jgi:hypothetical protein
MVGTMMRFYPLFDYAIFKKYSIIATMDIDIE